MKTLFMLALIVGGPLFVVYLVFRMTGSSRPKGASAGGGFSLGGCCSGLHGTFRHPIRTGTSCLAGFVGWLRRGLSRWETRLNLSIINDTVAEKRDQAKVLEQLLGEVGQLGLKSETVTALQDQIKATHTTADGLAASTSAFGELLQALVKKESEHTKIKVLAAQAATLRLPQAATEDIEERLRIVGGELEVERVKFAQQVEHMAGRAQRT